jgi:hypothetical protein
MANFTLMPVDVVKIVSTSTCRINTAYSDTAAGQWRLIVTLVVQFIPHAIRLVELLQQSE